MERRAREIADELETAPASVPEEQRRAAQELLRWMADDHFTFLGYREYELTTENGEEVLRGVPGHGPRRAARTAAARRTPAASPTCRPTCRPPAHAPPPDRHEGQRPQHGPPARLPRLRRREADRRRRPGDRRAPLRRALDGAVLPGRRPWTSRSCGPRSTPSSTRAGLPPDSHDGRELWNILETFPRDDLFQISTDELFEIAIGILNLQERKQVRLFARRDPYGRFVSCLVYVPRDRYSANVVAKVEQVLLAAYGGVSAEYRRSSPRACWPACTSSSSLGRDAPAEVDAARGRAAAGGGQPLVDRRPARRARRRRGRGRRAHPAGSLRRGLPGVLPGAVLARGPRSTTSGGSPRLDGRREPGHRPAPGLGRRARGPAARSCYPRASRSRCRRCCRCSSTSGCRSPTSARTSCACPTGCRRWLYDFGLRAPAGAVGSTATRPATSCGRRSSACGGARSRATASTGSCCWPA